jgi:flavin reductase (DIM6/NTAB) family NADH-FMN oxidoreductase RutF
MITTVNGDGLVNVAPYSYFMPVTGAPPLVAVTMGARRQNSSAPKDTWNNVNRSGEFVVNITTASIRDRIEAAAMAFPPEVSEAEVLGFATAPSQRVTPPGLVDSPVQLECRVQQVVPLGLENQYWSTVNLVVAEVVYIILDESVCSTDYRVDVHALGAVGRMTFPHFVQADGDALFALERRSYDDYAADGQLPGRLP